MAKVKQQELEQERWEDLMDLRKSIVKELIGNNEFLKSIVEGFKEQMNQDEELKQIVAGVFNSLTDISNVIYENTKKHVVFNEKNEMVDYKKGVIEENDLSYLDYKTIYNNYVEVSEQIVHIISLGYQEIVSRVNEKLKLLSDAEINSITKVYNKEQLKLLKKTRTVMRNAYGLTGKTKTKKPKGERHGELKRDTKPRSKNKYGSNSRKSGGDSSNKGESGSKGTTDTTTDSTATTATGTES